jgi:hypothetical protein
LRYLDAVVGILRDAGFSLPDIARAFMAVDSHIYGFTLQELSWPFDLRDAPQVAATMARDVFGEAYPSLRAMAEMAASGPGAPVDFEFGLDLLLDGLERLVAGT